MSDYKTGWRAISKYTGATRFEVRAAVESGELRCEPVRVQRRHLDGWMRLRALRARLAELDNERVDVTSDGHEPADRVVCRGA